MTPSARARKKRRELFLANDAAERLGLSPRVRHHGLPPSRANRLRVENGEPREIPPPAPPWRRPASGSAVPVQQSPGPTPPLHPNCRSTLVAGPVQGQRVDILVVDDITDRLGEPGGYLTPDMAKSFMDIVLQPSRLLDVVAVDPPVRRPTFSTLPSRPLWEGTDNHRGRSTRGILRRE